MKAKKADSRKRNIGRQIFLTMAVSSVLILLVVYLFLSAYIRGRAEEAIRESTVYTSEDGWGYRQDDETGEDTFFEVFSFIDAPGMEESGGDDSSGYTGGDWDWYWEWEYYSGETQLVEWCRAHPETMGETVRAALDGQIYYIQQTPLQGQTAPAGQDGNESSAADGEEDILITCVNVTSSIWMLSMTEVLLAVVLAVCTAVASWLGYRTDKAIRQEQEKQKRFFENASHELKTPLMSIRGFAEGMQKGIVQDEAHGLAVITEEANKMACLVDDILALSRADRGLDELKREDISVSELVGDCLDTLEAEIRKRQLQVDIRIEDRFLSVDVQKMKQAVTNILANAIRYAQKEISVSFSQNTLRIWDDGRQLSEEEQQHMFERFHTGDGGSTGIGMALAREITEQHGFVLSVKNESEGVCFAIGMPDAGSRHPA